MSDKDIEIIRDALCLLPNWDGENCSLMDCSEEKRTAEEALARIEIKLRKKS